MKIPAIILGAALVSAGFVQAEDVKMWNGGATGKTLECGYVWADDDSYGTRIVWRRGMPEVESYDIPTAADTVVMDNTATLRFDIYKTDIDIAGLNNTRWDDKRVYWRDLYFYKDNSVFNVSGAFNAMQGLSVRFQSAAVSDTGGSLAKATVKIGGDVTVGKDNYTASTTVLFGNTGDINTGGLLDYVEIGGNVYINNNKASTVTGSLRNRVSFNVGTRAAGASYDVNSPDILIKGSVQVLGTSAGVPYLWINDRANGVGTTTVLSVGGIDGNLSVYSGGSQTSDYDAALKNHTLGVIVFTQGSGLEYTTTSGTIADSSDFGVYCEQVKLKMVMSGAGTQTIKSSKLQFSGGVEMNNGKLLLNNSASGATGYEMDDSSTTLYTHGDLVMNFGTFGFYYRADASPSKAWSFNNIKWTDGTIQLCVYDNYMDTIKLDAVDGAGGAFTLEDGGQTVNFYFDGFLDYLYNNEVRIIEWTDYDNDLNFAANDSYIMGNDVKAQFRAADDGLYVKYVNAVPEPSTCALIFGAFAAAFAFVRRRK